MKRLPIVLLILVAGSFLAFKTIGAGNNNPPTKYEEILRLVGEMLKQAHFSPQDINDDFSQKVFKKYIDGLDPEKTFFLQSDVDALAAKYKNRVDDEIKGAPVEFFLEAGKVFKKRMEESSKMAAEVLKEPFNYAVDEEVVLDGEKLKYPANDAERKERWRKKMKFMSLERYSDLLDTREKNKGKDSFVVKKDAELEKEAREKTEKVINRVFDRFKFKFSDDDMFNVYVNAITTIMDPHTEFFPPVDKRYFDEEMSGSFFGIGASLQYDEGNIKITSIVSGSPAFKSGELQVGDVIQKVAQGPKAEPVELIGYLVTDAVKLIRGKEGSEVTLTIKRKDGTVKTITLKREKIENDIDTYARSAVVKQGNEKIGYIYLPEFYADFENPNGRRSYLDVAREVQKLKEEQVDGIVIDLRNNGGGSLYDVVQMAGLFIDEGPIVQVKDKDNKPSILKDKDKSVLYSGPLAVMVNEFSASASEIFAAAIQDYGRGVIIGSTSTYGKGTVQRNIGIDQNGFSPNSELGTVKLTLQKFYRINGGSTQLKGVASDIVLPDQYEYLKVREKDDENALGWDEISKSPYGSWNAGYDLKTIQALSNQRLEKDSTFKLIQRNAQWLSKENDKSYSLQLDKYKKEQKAIRETVSQTENLMKLKNELTVTPLTTELNKWSEDKTKQERFNAWLKNLRQDIYLDQAVKVVNDVINQQNIAKGGKPAQEAPKKAF